MEFSAKWSTDSKRIEKAFCCIQALAKDVAKISQLILLHGKWNNEQIIS